MARILACINFYITMKPEDYPEITVQQLVDKLESNPEFHLVDVRELWELNYAQIRHPRVTVLPMSLMAREKETAFPVALRNLQADIVIMCHHGIRSMQVTQWMRAQGWKNVFSLEGGIDEYARQIDPSVGSY